MPQNKDTKHDKIARRLTEIILKLNNGERFSIEELQEEFGVSKRTIQRDLMERLQVLPLQCENGYYSLEPYALGKLSFSDVQHFAALCGVRSLFPSLDKSFIVDLFNEKINSAYLVKEKGYENLEGKDNAFQALSAAIISKKMIRFHYKEKERYVSPYKLVNNNAVWYLLAVEDKVLKHFTFTKIEDLKICREVFVPEPQIKEIIEKNELSWFTQNPVDVTLHVDNTVKEYFLRRKFFPSQKVVDEDETGLLLSVRVAYDDEILGFVKYWLPHLTIISPSSLQEKLEGILLGYLKN
ncbi:WYL domain-containing protein [Sulfurovum sp.]|uniref:helix-turn-helix transcriptional regulator n=1 Tax=Sulfurovum sp. TaxID=1969726 RepID=UPI0025E927AC|nr:WYL domain-containing protein [Sulfurovum sp.]